MEQASYASRMMRTKPNPQPLKVSFPLHRTTKAGCAA